MADGGDWASEVRLRSASAGDAGAVSELVAAAYGHYVERIGGPPRPMTDDYAEVIASREVTLAEHDGALVGLVVLDITDEGFLIDNVAVGPSWQGRGVGRLLLDHAERRAREQGFDSLYLYTHELMTENQALYARLGFAEYERRRHGDASIVYMRKRLG